MTPTLETPRLWLRPVALDDAPQIQAIFPQWEVVQFLASVIPWPYPPDGAATFIQHVLLPAVERIELHVLAWEDVVDVIERDDAAAGAELRAFLSQCLEFNRPRVSGTGRSRS